MRSDGKTNDGSTPRLSTGKEGQRRTTQGGSTPPVRLSTDKRPTNMSGKDPLLIAAIQTSGKKGLAEVKKFMVPSTQDYKPETPIYLAKENTFFFNEVRRVLVDLMAY